MPPTHGESNRAAEREEMVATQIENRGVRNARVLDAMRRVPREWFVPPSASNRAYQDGAMPIACDQTISQPFMVAKMTELLELPDGATVLEIGTGSGYQSAILALLAERVFTIEWHLALMTQAARNLERVSASNVVFRCTDGSVGWPERAPFDGIIVTAGAPDVPTALRDQLRVGGRLVLPVGPKEDQTLVVVRRGESGFERLDYFRCRFVKLMGEAGWRN